MERIAAVPSVFGGTELAQHLARVSLICWLSSWFLAASYLMVYRPASSPCVGGISPPGRREGQATCSSATSTSSKPARASPGSPPLSPSSAHGSCSGSLPPSRESPPPRSRGPSGRILGFRQRRATVSLVGRFAGVGRLRAHVYRAASSQCVGGNSPPSGHEGQLMCSAPTSTSSRTAQQGARQRNEGAMALPATPGGRWL
jgi:hypothetical protein